MKVYVLPLTIGLAVDIVSEFLIIVMEGSVEVHIPDPWPNPIGFDINETTELHVTGGIPTNPGLTLFGLILIVSLALVNAQAPNVSVTVIILTLLPALTVIGLIVFELVIVRSPLTTVHKYLLPEDV